MSRGIHIVSRHLLRRRAREEQHRLIRVKAAARRRNPSRAAAGKLALLQIGLSDSLRVERAGRLRARWVVKSYPVNPKGTA